MVFKTGDGISIQLILIFKLVKGNLKTKFPHNRAPLHISSNTNKQFRKTIWKLWLIGQCCQVVLDWATNQTSRKDWIEGVVHKWMRALHMKPKSTKRSWSDDIDLFINQFFLTLTIGQGPQLRTIAVYVHEEVYQIWLKWVCELAVFQTSSLPLLNWPRRFPKKHLYALEKNKFIRKFSSPRACIFTCNLFFKLYKARW